MVLCMEQFPQAPRLKLKSVDYNSLCHLCEGSLKLTLEYICILWYEHQDGNHQLKFPKL